MVRVELLAYTPMPEHIVASAAKLCYSPSTIQELREGLTDEKAAAFVDMLSEIGHESPIEHAVFTFGIEGVSRSLLAQITRHRIASFSVQSQRYVREKSFEYIIPPEIQSNPQALELFEQAMAQDQEYYDKLTEILKAKHMEDFIKSGMPEKEAARAAEKKAIEDARYVLPNACATKLIVTFNARSLHNFFALRCCNRAQWEIRELAEKMLELCLEAAPGLFKNCGPACLNEKCPEGKMTCGKINEVRERYKQMKGK
ncbi:MAG TPA: FAD-dependent thymidylate synthase [Clostridiales bacterium]|nr:FAD-dependent thymidylate synthase [Clostridiales bacterium]